MSRVLVVDDDAVCVDLMRRALALEGHEVAVATECQQALALAGSFRPDVLLTDVWLSESMTGADVAHGVLDAHPDVRLIVLSGLPENDVKTLMASLPVERYLAKPVDMDELVRAVAGPGRLMQMDTLKPIDADELPGKRESGLSVQHFGR